MANLMGELYMLPVTITKQDIREGKKGDAYNCAIARALKRIFNTQSVSVSGSSATIDGVSYRLPQEAYDFVSRFDNLKTSVQPFTFQLGTRTGY